MKFGFEYISINTEVQDTNPLYGLDTYSSQFSRPTTSAANNQIQPRRLLFRRARA